MGHKYVSFLKCHAPRQDTLLQFGLTNAKQIWNILPISLWVHATAWIYTSVKPRQEINRLNKCSAVTDLPAVVPLWFQRSKGIFFFSDLELFGICWKMAFSHLDGECEWYLFFLLNDTFFLLLLKKDMNMLEWINSIYDLLDPYVMLSIKKIIIIYLSFFYFVLLL